MDEVIPRHTERTQAPTTRALGLMRVRVHQWQAAGALTVVFSLHPGWLLATGIIPDWRYLTHYGAMWVPLALVAASTRLRRYRVSAALSLIGAIALVCWSFNWLIMLGFVPPLLEAHNLMGIALVSLDVLCATLLCLAGYLSCRNSWTLWHLQPEPQPRGLIP